MTAGNDAESHLETLATSDPEVKGRLNEIVRAGELFVDRREFSRALSPRVCAAYPSLAEDLFSTDLEMIRTTRGHF